MYSNPQVAVLESGSIHSVHANDVEHDKAGVETRSVLSNGNMGAFCMPLLHLVMLSSSTSTSTSRIRGSAPV